MPRDHDGAAPVAAADRPVHGREQPFEKFLNPQSMLTPGICGVLAVTITNALTQRFDIPEAWVGLTVSAVLAFLVVLNVVPLLHRAAYFVANTLMIFSMAFGVASTSGALPSAPRKASAFLLIGPVVAQTNDDATRLGGAAATLASECANAPKINASPGVDRFCSDFLNSYRANAEVKAIAPVPMESVPKSAIEPVAPKAEGKAFFRPWRF